MSNCGVICRLLLVTSGLNIFTAEAWLFQSQDSEGCGTWDEKLVTVAQGTLRGSTLTSEKGRPFCAFRGIPFSQSPVGEYRFQPPREPKPWEGVLDVSDEMPQCISFLPITGSVFGQEDCLYLSVFTPKLKFSSEELLDVMVWIFPGENYFGITNTFLFGPHYLMDKDMIVVYINYRVGVMGYISTGDDEAPGNYGLKDQVAGLRWVKNNIEAFGGNPNSVTIFGQSSGAASVHLHILSPLSKGLFHRAISMGSTAICPWARTLDPLRQAKRQAHAVGCPTNSSSSLISCLREMNAHKLVRSLHRLFLFWVLPGPGYAVVVEKKTEFNPDPFMPEDPLELMQTGKFERVPWLLGGNSQEVGPLVVPTFTVNVLRHQLNRLVKQPKFLKSLFIMDISAPPDQAVNISQKIASHYVGPVLEISSDNEVHILNAFSDRFMVHGIHKSAQLHSLAGQTIFKYNFAYRGLYSGSTLTTLRNFGTTHADELMYLFKLFGGAAMFPPRHNDIEVREMLLTFVANFIKFGNPTPSGHKSGNYLVDKLNWDPVGQTSLDNMHMRYLNIGQVEYPGVSKKYLNIGLGPVKLHMATDLFKERMDFWDSLPLRENCLRNCR